MKVSISELENDKEIKAYKVLSYKKIVSKSKDFDEENLIRDQELLKNIILKLCKTCLANGGIGLAAPQVGIFKKLFVIRDFIEQDDGSLALQDTFSVFINPSWTKAEANIADGEEGCLSVPDVIVNVKRFIKIKAKWIEFNEDFTEISKKEMILENYQARVFQHEHDHLKTISLIDKYKEQKKGP